MTQLAARKAVFEEPKAGVDVEEVLQQYASCCNGPITSSCACEAGGGITRLLGRTEDTSTEQVSYSCLTSMCHLDGTSTSRDTDLLPLSKKRRKQEANTKISCICMKANAPLFQSVHAMPVHTACLS